MRPSFLALPILLVCAAGVAEAAPFGDSLFKIAQVRRSDLRDAVMAHRNAQREEVRREEAAAGRRLTPAELYELRQQVRGQWTPPGVARSTLNSAESQPAERIAPAPTSAARSLMTTTPLGRRP